MKIILLGPPGSGKGTYAQRLSPKLEIPQISTGDLFREHIKNKTEIGEKAKSYIEKGELVPDEITIAMLKERLEKEDCAKGFILDGFPRTLQQAQALEKIEKIDAVINLVVPEEVIIARLTSRRQCKKCGKIYNIRFLKPRVSGICDSCGGELFQREDDTEPVIKQRIETYRRQTQPLIEYYENIKKDVECNQVDIPPEVIVEKILKVLKFK